MTDQPNWRPWALAAAIGALVYMGSNRAGAPPARNWDLQAWSRQPPAPPPVAAPQPFLPPTSGRPSPPPVTAWPLPPVVAPDPIVKETRRKGKRQKLERAQKPVPQKQQQRQATEPDALPSCAQICAWVAGKSRDQLRSEGANMSISPRLRAHGMACYVRCRK